MEPLLFLLSLQVSDLWFLSFLFFLCCFTCSYLELPLKGWSNCNFNSGPQKKRERDDNIQPMLKRQQLGSSFSTDETFISVTCNGCCSDSGFDRNKHGHTEAAMETTSTVSDGDEGNLNHELQQSSERLKKRKRPFRWQRCRKRRQLTSQETSVKGPFTTVLDDKESLPSRLSCCLKPSSGHHDTKVLWQILQFSYSKFV